MGSPNWSCAKCVTYNSQGLTQRAVGFGGDLEDYAAQLGCSRKGATTLICHSDKWVFSKFLTQTVTQFAALSFGGWNFPEHCSHVNAECQIV